LNTWIIEPQLEYSTTTGNIKWDALAGTTFQDNTRQGQTNLALGITNDALLENESAASRIVLMDNNYSRYRYNAIYARLNATWKDKLVINLTGRRDGSSRFGAENRFHNFWSAGGGWIFKRSESETGEVAVRKNKQILMDLRDRSTTMDESRNCNLLRV